VSHLLDRRDAFVQIPQRIRLDPASAPIATPANVELLGAYVLLYLDRDSSWPAPTYYPAWLLPKKRKALEAARLIEPLPGGTYTIPGYDASRQKRHDHASKGAGAVGHAPDGTFARTAGSAAPSGDDLAASSTAPSGDAPPLRGTHRQTHRHRQTSDVEKNVGSSVRIGQENTQSSVSAREGSLNETEASEPEETTPPDPNGALTAEEALLYGSAIASGPMSPGEFRERRRAKNVPAAEPQIADDDDTFGQGAFDRLEARL